MSSMFQPMVLLIQPMVLLIQPMVLLIQPIFPVLSTFGLAFGR